MVAVLRADDRFAKANENYRNGRFREAAEQYEALLENDGPRVSVLQNLGSAYHQLGENGRAILAFERALLLKPGDADIEANLKLVRDRSAVFPGGPDDRWSKLAGSLSRRSWSMWLLAGALMLPVAAILWIIRRSMRMASVLLAIAGALISAASWWALGRSAGVGSLAIVVNDDAKVSLSPFESAGETGTLPAGREVRTGDERNGFRWVSVDGGATAGWMKIEDIEPLVPQNPRTK
ncbi:MAG: tetratricopeptide repeat protein [Verrucomicrobiae bacterium]|nr:tetratricopeptide repeat protein [Verrucomicrobiae bacterium]